MKRLLPLRTYSSPSRTAVVRIAAESEPEPASVSAYAGSHSPLASLGRYASFCACEPASLRPSEPSSCTASRRPLVAQTFETSSIATSASSVPVPEPPCSSSKSSPKISCSRKSSTMSQGNSCDSSISAARGATRSRASVRTSSRISRCSSVRTSQGTRRLYGLAPGFPAVGGRRRRHAHPRRTTRARPCRRRGWSGRPGRRRSSGRGRSRCSCTTRGRCLRSTSSQQRHGRDHRATTRTTARERRRTRAAARPVPDGRRGRRDRSPASCRCGRGSAAACPGRTGSCRRPETKSQLVPAR